MKNKIMVFWPYDLFPYLLYGEASTKVPEKIIGDGVIYYVESYQGFASPSFVLPKKDGENLANLIDELKRQKKLAQKNLDEEYEEHLDRILGEYGVSRK